MVLGVIGGTSLFGTKLVEAAKEKEVDTLYGTVYLLIATVQSHEIIFIPRHGKDRNIPPHRIKYKANICAFKEFGVEEIIGVTSVGSLKRAIPPQSMVVPHDYVSLYNIPTFYDNEIVHITPSLDEDLRRHIIRAIRTLGGIEIVEHGVYFQTVGARLETRAEINLIKDYADVVGMNMASEATLAIELGLRYANISTVENYAHGIIVDEALDYKDILISASRSRENVEKVLVKVIEEAL